MNEVPVIIVVNSLAIQRTYHSTGAGGRHYQPTFERAGGAAGVGLRQLSTAHAQQEQLLLLLTSSWRRRR
jgi:hypothetical protein